MSDIIQKRLMAFAGLTWFIYLVFHMLANLQFFSGEKAFNGFYNWFNESSILYVLVSAILLVGLLFHVFVAVSRQLKNNELRRSGYEKPYPKGVPRIIAWSGAIILLTFIIIHVIQVLILSDEQALYSALKEIFTNPVNVIIYALGLLALSAHLYHALSSVLQTLGIGHQQNHYWVLGILFILIGGFASVPFTIIFIL